MLRLPADHLSLTHINTETGRMEDIKSLSLSDLKADNRIRVDINSSERSEQIQYISSLQHRQGGEEKKHSPNLGHHIISIFPFVLSIWSSIKGCHFLDNMHMGREKALSAYPPVLVLRRHPFGLSAPVGDHSFCLHLLPFLQSLPQRKRAERSIFFCHHFWLGH